MGPIRRGKNKDLQREEADSKTLLSAFEWGLKEDGLPPLPLPAPQGIISRQQQQQQQSLPVSL